jgi:hypothetical protein
MTKRCLLKATKKLHVLTSGALYDLFFFPSTVDVSNVLRRDNLRTLREKLRPTRTTLLATLSCIFPIELSSPPDLLYTILDAPLPIPLASNDPAPPMSLPAHKEVTEEATATALGYVAQVLHMLAAYLGKTLVYPVTCIGSRSLIKDGISAMIGPRMWVSAVSLF